MYKLVVIGGKLRGQEFILQEGDNVIGRDSSCDIPLDVRGVSKKHVTVTVTGDVAYVQDMNSSNGTFVNGKIVKRATVKKGDKLALPDVIMQVVFVKEKKVIVKKKVKNEEEDDNADYLTGGAAPNNILEKLVHTFKYKLMRILYGINEEYEWRILFAILLVLFVVATITLTIFPILQDSKQLLFEETAKRGAHYADEIARLNNRALEQKNLDRVDTNFLEREQGVASYELFDLEGRIVRPLGKLNDYVSDPFSIKAREWAFENKDDATVLKRELGEGELGIAQKIMAYNSRAGVEEAVGVIAIRFAPESLARVAKKNSKAYLEAIVTSAIVAVVFFGMVYFLTVRPIEELKYQMEEALRGKRRNIEGEHMMSELNPLKNSVNSVLQRVRELQNDGTDDFEEAEDDGAYVTTLGEFLIGSSGPAMVLDSQKQVQKMNLEAEDLTGIRESGAQGMSLLDVSREQGFAATVIELCDMSANNAGTNQSGEYELGGMEYQVHVSALMGKDNFAKAFYITFVGDN